MMLSMEESDLPAILPLPPGVHVVDEGELARVWQPYVVHVSRVLGPTPCAHRQLGRVCLTVPRVRSIS